MAKQITEQKIVNAVSALRKLSECEGVTRAQKETLQAALVTAQKIYAESPLNR